MAEILLRWRGQMKEWERYISKLDRGKGSIRNMHVHASGVYAKHIKKVVQREYLKSNYPITEGTEEAYKHKTAGVSGPAYPSNFSSLNHTGQLVNSIIVAKIPRHGFVVQVDPAAMYRNGRSVSRIADQLEFGSVFSFTLAGEKERKWLAFLHIVRPGDASKYTKGATIVVSKTPRPVWLGVYEDLPKYRKVYERAAFSWLKKRRKESGR